MCRLDNRLLKEGEGLVHGEGVFYAEGAAAGADEAAEVSAGAEGFAKVPGEGADVGTFGAGDADDGLRQPQGRCIRHVYTGRR